MGQSDDESCGKDEVVDRNAGGAHEGDHTDNDNKSSRRCARIIYRTGIRKECAVLSSLLTCTGTMIGEVEVRAPIFGAGAEAMRMGICCRLQINRDVGPLCQA
jgi:hypothetical protein